ncbi:MAG: hypothetical protein BroJett040_09780 [Oligoflexia bacterium]|nr:MAG: hypothetical protein BroJett040_09780 [Oligoflexia bacterium]
MTDVLTNQALVVVVSDLASGERHLKKMVRELEKISKVKTISSVYKKNHHHQYDSLNSQLWVALRVETDDDPRPFYQKLRQIGDGGTQYSRGQVQLLVFNSLIQLDPAMPLPHPLLQSEKVALKCAAEAWGQYEHPILGQTLNELVMSYPDPESLEFYFQGAQLF